MSESDMYTLPRYRKVNLGASGEQGPFIDTFGESRQKESIYKVQSTKLRTREGPIGLVNANRAV